MKTKGLISIVPLACLLLAACNSEKGKREQGSQAQYRTLTIGRSDQILTSEYTARLTGRQIVEIRPQVSGNITRICINEGQQVTKGQTLFIIDQVPYQAALEAAKASVATAQAKMETARMEYESSQTLKTEQVVSDYTVRTMLNTLNEAKAALAQAKAQELNARNNLGYTVVKSPVSGSASMIPYHVGALVSSSISEPLVTVADDHEMYAYFSVTENQTINLIQQYGSIEQFIKQAPEVELRLSNGTTYPQKGRINAVSGTVDASTGAVSLRATFPNANHLLHNGGSGSVVVSTHRKDCIVIPQEATYELQNRVFVYRVIDGKTKATPVEVFRLNNGKEYIVESGLSEGDVIIAEGAGLLKEGVEVKGEKVRK
jgi:membrane fusion protein (multidrug efflux system)